MLRASIILTMKINLQIHLALALTFALCTACRPPDAAPPPPQPSSKPSGVEVSATATPAAHTLAADAAVSSTTAKAKGVPSGRDQQVADADRITLMSFNVRNYVRIPRFIDGVETPDMPKPESEIAAVISIITSVKPDILGVQEMGPPDQFDDFRRRLSTAGIDLPHTKHLQAFDKARHLVLLSRFPIVADDSVADLYYELHGVQEPVQRGFLDVTVQIRPDYLLRVLNVHLKSRRPVPQGEALMRRAEARLFRKHVESIFEQNPDIRLVALGDFNDTKDQTPIQDIMGVRGSLNYLGDLWLSDSDGDRWTHFYARADSYSRIDYFFFSPTLWRDVNKDASFIYDAPNWREASDHRPIVAVLELPKSPNP